MEGLKKKILVIDNEPAFLALIKDSLDSQRYDFEVALDGTEGLLKVAASKPDLILLDLNMPHMDGMEFLRKLNEQYKKDKIPIIITTNDPSMDKITEGVALGIRGYVVKVEESLRQIASTIDSVFA